MKIKLFIWFFFFSLTFSNAQNYKLALQEIDRLHLDGGSYILKKGNSAMSYTANEDYIITHKYDSISKTLDIKVRAKEKFKHKKKSLPVIELSLPSIKEINISSAAKLDVLDTFQYSNFKLKVHEASYCKLAIISDTVNIIANEASKIKAYTQSNVLFASAKEASKMTINGNWENVNITAQEASKIEISGKSNKLKVKAEEASTINANELLAKTGEIIAEEASSVKVNVSDTLIKVVREVSSITNYSNNSKNLENNIIESDKCNKYDNYLAELFSYLIFIPFLWIFAILLIPILIISFLF